jgi:hypothetical protein
MKFPLQKSTFQVQRRLIPLLYGIIMVDGDKTKKLEWALASLDSMSGTKALLPRKTRWADFTYFLLKMCFDIHT